jgi:hypothetical protein
MMKKLSLDQLILVVRIVLFSMTTTLYSQHLGLSGRSWHEQLLIHAVWWFFLDAGYRVYLRLYGFLSK